MKRREVLFIFSFFLALFISGEAALAQGEGKPKKAIALIEFENLTDYKEGDIGGRIVSLLETELVKLKRFNVIERQLGVERVAKVLKHPVTGKVIGVIRDEVGEIEIKETYDTYSKAQIKKTKKGEEIKVGDLCISKVK